MQREAADDINARYIAQTIEAATAGDVEAAEEVLSLFRGAVDAHAIDGVSEQYRRIAEYLAECFWRYDQGTDIARALRLEAQRSRGQPKGTTKVNHDSYAALMILLKRHLGSAEKAKAEILCAEQDKRGKGPASKRILDSIYANYAPARGLDHDLLVSMLSPAHRKLFGISLRRNSIGGRP
jgi:hypothetical protein